MLYIIVYFLSGGYKYFKDYFPGGKYPNIVELDHKKVTGNTQVTNDSEYMYEALLKTAAEATTTVPSSACSFDGCTTVSFFVTISSNRGNRFYCF